MASLGVLARVDHLVYTTPDLDRGIAEIELLLGVRPTVGRRDPTWGTHNALAALGRPLTSRFWRRIRNTYPAPAGVLSD